MAASITAMMLLCYRFGIRELQLEWTNRTTLTVYENIYRLATNPTETGQWVYTFALGGALVMLLLGGMLPPTLLVADPPHRLPHRLQFRYADPLAQLFYRLGL